MFDQLKYLFKRRSRRQKHTPIDPHPAATISPAPNNLEIHQEPETLASEAIQQPSESSDQPGEASYQSEQYTSDFASEQPCFPLNNITPNQNINTCSQDNPDETIGKAYSTDERSCPSQGIARPDGHMVDTNSLPERTFDDDSEGIEYIIKTLNLADQLAGSSHSSSNNTEHTHHHSSTTSITSQDPDAARLHHDLSSGKVYLPDGQLISPPSIPSPSNNSEPTTATSWLSVFDNVQNHPNVTMHHHETDVLPIVTHETIKTQVHNVQTIHRTASVHFHESRLVIQPVVDTEGPPVVLPEEHWLRDGETGEMVKISTEVGNRLMEGG